jgi:hypothetical protein
VWLKAVMADDGVPPLGFKLAYALSEYVNKETGEAWPSVTTLAADAHISERSAWKFLRILQERGHLAVETGAGRAATNRYQLTLKLATDEPKIKTKIKKIKKIKKTLHGQVKNPARKSKKPCTLVQTNLLKNLLKNLLMPLARALTRQNQEPKNQTGQNQNTAASVLALDVRNPPKR